MTVNTAGGSTFHIGPVIDALTDTVAEFQTLSYVEVGEIEDLGQIGDEDSEVQFTAVGDRRVRKLKGPSDAGTLQVVCGDDDSDNGQVAMLAAFADKTSEYAFKIVLANQLTISGDPGEMYFRGRVMSKRRNVGNVSNVVRRNFNVAVNSEVLEVAAT